MLVVFTVGDPPVEDVLMHSVSSSSSEAIDLTDDSQPGVEPSQPAPTSQLLKKRQLSSGKKPREDEQFREGSLQPAPAAMASAGLGEQGSTAGPLSSQQPLSPERSSQLPGGASGSGHVQQQSDTPERRPAQANMSALASPSEQFGSGLAAAGSSVGPSLDSPPASPQVSPDMTQLLRCQSCKLLPDRPYTFGKARTSEGCSSDADKPTICASASSMLYKLNYTGFVVVLRCQSRGTRPRQEGNRKPGFVLLSWCCKAWRQRRPRCRKRTSSGANAAFCGLISLVRICQGQPRQPSNVSRCTEHIQVASESKGPRMMPDAGSSA